MATGKAMCTAFTTALPLALFQVDYDISRSPKKGRVKHLPL